MTLHSIAMAKMAIVQDTINTVLRPIINQFNKKYNCDTTAVIAGGVCRDWYFSKKENLDLKGTSGDVDIIVSGMPEGIPEMVLFNTFDLALRDVSCIRTQERNAECASKGPVDRRITEVLQYTHTTDALNGGEPLAGYGDIEVDIIFMCPAYKDAAASIEDFDSPLNKFAYAAGEVFNCGYTLATADDFSYIGSAQTNRREKIARIYKQVAAHAGVELVEMYGLAVQPKGAVLEAFVRQGGIDFHVQNVLTGEKTRKLIEVPYYNYYKWLQGELIQSAMPMVCADDRGLLVSGIATFDEMFEAT